MKNVLHKRFLREFRGDFYKYAVIFFIMILMIGETSGFLVTAEGLIRSDRESYEKYQIEDGNFRLTYQLGKEEMERAEKSGIRLYENFARELRVLTFPSGKPREEHPKTSMKLRIFQNREDINLSCLMEGRFPEKRGEIAFDQTVARNKGLKIGDEVKTEEGDQTFRLVGFVALSDYSSMFEQNADSVFDASGFGVALVAKEEFQHFDRKLLRYIYSYHYLEAPKNDYEKKEKGDALVKELSTFMEIEEFVPAYLNQAITFAGNDFTSDRVMLRIFLYVVMAIMAFIFAITISNTISKESEVIGTLLASGYRKSEITFHYMMIPVIVTVVSALVGNLLGYFWFQGMNASLYTNSYSLPEFEVKWSGNAFFETTVSTMMIMLSITYIGIRRKLSLSPLKFLNHDLSKKRKRKVINLSVKIPFFTRFRLRVIFQNTGNYLMLFIGVLFAYFILMFGLIFPVMLDKFEESMKTNRLAEYQYLLSVSPKMYKNPQLLLELQTKNEAAEKFSLRVLLTDKELGREEDIMLYGIEKESAYVLTGEGEDYVLISRSFADKFGLEEGDSVTLHEKYEENKYSLKITGIHEYEGTLAVFMNRDKMNRLLELREDFFSGYFTNEKLTDLKEEVIGTVIDLEVLTKISRQMKISMGGLMNIINFLGMMIFGMMIYLLTKTIIEKNAASISMAKIMGYRYGEIYRLYVGATTAVMIIFLIIGIPLIEEGMKRLFYYLFRTKLKGMIPVHITIKEELTMFILGLLTYLVVSFIEYRRIKRIPMEEVLKNAE